MRRLPCPCSPPARANHRTHLCESRGLQKLRLLKFLYYKYSTCTLLTSSRIVQALSRSPDQVNVFSEKQPSRVIQLFYVALPEIEFWLSFVMSIKKSEIQRSHHTDPDLQRLLLSREARKKSMADRGTSARFPREPRLPHPRWPYLTVSMVYIWEDDLHPDSLKCCESSDVRTGMVII